MTPPPRVQLCSNWCGENPAPCLRFPAIGLPAPGRSAPGQRLARSTHQSAAARFGSVGGEGVGGGGVGVELEDEVAEEGARAPSPLGQSFLTGDRPRRRQASGPAEGRGGKRGLRSPIPAPRSRRPRKPLGGGRRGRDQLSRDRPAPDLGRGASGTPPRGGGRGAAARKPRPRPPPRPARAAPRHAGGGLVQRRGFPPGVGGVSLAGRPGGPLPVSRLGTPPHTHIHTHPGGPVP